jgi:iron(III) transport system ATP-binding protein
MNALEVHGVAMSFGATEVLTNVSLSVPKHSITAVLGSSGSGKTTLLRIIAGFERPRAGQVSLAGQVIDGPGQHVPPERRRLGYVPQEGALFPHLTAARNVGFGLRRGARDSARVAELLDLVGLSDLGQRYPHELSGGQQQRVALARAMALDPPVVLLDEPFSSLDAALRVSVRADIARVLRTAGTSVVLVTHDQQEALSMADQVAVLRHGHVAQVGTPRDIYARPVDPEMATFLGEANLVDAQVHDSTAATALGPLTTEIMPNGASTALLRPEQISISPGHTGYGLTGRVLEQTYQGHESVIIVSPDRHCGPATIRVRIQGTATYTVGSPVTLTAAGKISAWPNPTITPSANPRQPTPPHPLTSAADPAHRE